MPRYKDYEDWYDNGPGSEAFKRNCRVNPPLRLANRFIRETNKHYPFEVVESLQPVLNDSITFKHSGRFMRGANKALRKFGLHFTMYGDTGLTLESTYLKSGSMAPLISALKRNSKGGNNMETLKSICIFLPSGKTFSFYAVELLCDNETILEFRYSAMSDGNLKIAKFLKSNIVGWSTRS